MDKHNLEQDIDKDLSAEEHLDGFETDVSGPDFQDGLKVEIQDEIQKMMQDKFGDKVKIMGITDFQFHQEEEVAEPVEADQANTESDLSDHLHFDKKPREVKEFLDRYVIRQDECKKALAIAVCDHYNAVRMSLKKEGSNLTEFNKQNILMLGPTGVGKTYLVKQIAKLIGVPFVKADATRFTEMGFVGSNVDDLIRDLVAQAGGRTDLAQFGIIYLDEADKLATQSSHYGRDIGGRGVQTSLLKLMEETEVDLSASHDMASQIQSFMEFQKKGKLVKQVVNTRHILFIVSGAFSGLNEIIMRRIGGRTMGINTDILDSKDSSKLLPLATTADLVNFGFEPEFVGRLPVRVACQNLELSDFVHILQKSEGSILRQYKNDFLAYGIDIEFEISALEAIAEKAVEEKTGARALMTICEQTLREFKFELPSTDIKMLKVDRRLIENPKVVLKELLR